MDRLSRFAFKKRSALTALCFAAMLGVFPQATRASENPDAQSPTEIAAIHTAIDVEFARAILPEALTLSEQNRILTKYAALDPNHLVPSDLLSKAVLYFDANLVL